MFDFLKLKKGMCDRLQSVLLHDGFVGKSLTAILETHGNASLLFAPSQPPFSTSFFKCIHCANLIIFFCVQNLLVMHVSYENWLTPRVLTVFKTFFIFL